MDFDSCDLSVAILPQVKCKCESDDKCASGYYMVVPAFTVLNTGVESPNPPFCGPETPCYYCYEPCIEECYYVYDCLTASAGQDCGGDPRINCFPQKVSTWVVDSWQNTTRECCTWQN